MADAIRHPVIEPDRDVRPWQEVLVDLAGRLDFPAFTKPDGKPKYRDYQDFIVRYERAPGIGFLAGFRGVDGSKSLVGEPNPKQWEAYIANQAFFVHYLPEAHQWNRFANRGYLEFAKRSGFITDVEPIVLQLWSEPLQKFRLAGEGLYEGPRPRDPVDALRLATYSIRCRTGTRRSRWSARIARRFRCMRSRSARWSCTTHGILRTRGCARSWPRTRCT